MNGLCGILGISNLGMNGSCGNPAIGRMELFGCELLCFLQNLTKKRQKTWWFLRFLRENVQIGWEGLQILASKNWMDRGMNRPRGKSPSVPKKLPKHCFFVEKPAFTTVWGSLGQPPGASGSLGELRGASEDRRRRRRRRLTWISPSPHPITPRKKIRRKARVLT